MSYTAESKTTSVERNPTSHHPLDRNHQAALAKSAPRASSVVSTRPLSPSVTRPISSPMMSAPTPSTPQKMASSARPASPKPALQYGQVNSASSRRPASPTSRYQGGSPSITSPMEPRARVFTSARLKELYEEAERRNERLKILESQLPPDYTFSPAINRARIKDDGLTPEQRLERLYEDAKIKEARRKLAMEEASKKVDPEATFSPEVSAKAAKKASPGGPGTRAEKLYTDAQLLNQKRTALKEEAEKRAAAEHTFRPMLQPMRIRLGDPRPVSSPSNRRPSSPPPAPVPAVVNRLLLAEQRKAENLARLEREKTERDRAQYTFSPQLIARPSSPRQRAGSSGVIAPASSLNLNSPPGSNQDLAAEDKWSRLSRTGAKDYAALEKEKERMEVKDCTFKPLVHSSLPPSAAVVIASSEKMDVHSRLYEGARARAPSPKPISALPQTSFRALSSSPKVGRPVGPARGASPVTIAAGLTSTSISTPSSVTKGRSSSPLLFPSSPVLSNRDARQSPTVAFGRSTPSRIPDPKQAGVVVPTSEKDSSVVVPMDPKESAVVVPASPPMLTAKPASPQQQQRRPHSPTMRPPSPGSLKQQQMMSPQQRSGVVRPVAAAAVNRVATSPPSQLMPGMASSPQAKSSFGSAFSQPLVNNSNHSVAASGGNRSQNVGGGTTAGSTPSPLLTFSPSSSAGNEPALSKQAPASSASKAAARESDALLAQWSELSEEKPTGTVSSLLTENKEGDLLLNMDYQQHSIGAGDEQKVKEGNQQLYIDQDTGLVSASSFGMDDNFGENNETSMRMLLESPPTRSTKEKETSSKSNPITDYLSGPQTPPSSPPFKSSPRSMPGTPNEPASLAKKWTAEVVNEDL